MAHTPAEYSDPVLQEMQDEMEASRAAATTPVTSRIPQRGLLVLVSVMAIIVFLAWVGKITVRQGTGAVFGLALVLVAWLLVRPTPRELSYLELRMRLMNQLRFLRERPVDDSPEFYPDDRFQVSLVSKPRYLGDTNAHWMHRVRVFRPSLGGVVEDYLVKQDPRTGEIRGAELKPGGVWGHELSDVKYIPSGPLRAFRQTKRYIDTK